jgi:Glycosyltransferase family 87
MSTAADRARQDAVLSRSRRLLYEHRLFLLALLLGAVIRIVVLLAFTPALISSDGPAYLSFLDTFTPLAVRPAGYGLLVLYPLSRVTSSLVAVAVTQHLMGLATAVLVYLLLRRWGVREWLAVVATLPVLFDALQLLLEQSVLSDPLFELLVVLGVVVLGWRRRPGAGTALLAGLLLGASVTVRLVGEPLVVAGVGFCLLAGQSWRVRIATAAALAVGFAAPVAAYMTWYHHDHGVYALSQFGGTSLYQRTTPFVDCSRLSVPRYERVLCPPEPLGHRLSPDWYTWNDPRTLPRLRPPPGTTTDQAARQFAVAAIRAQPGEYARIVLRDFVLNFDVWRGDRFDYTSSRKWQFSRYLDPLRNPRLRTAYREHGHVQLVTHDPFASFLGVYGRLVYLPGPLVLVCMVLGLLGGLGVGRASRSGMRSICLLTTLTATGLLLVPDLVSEFVWRYQLPALALLPAGAALAVTAIRPGRARDDLRAGASSS